ncbi:MAG: sigma factor [Verrucomicrobiota bacterium]
MRKSFLTTRWSQIATAFDDSDKNQPKALNRLFEDYWYPIYAAIRRFGHPHHDAEDLCQQFFFEALKRKSFANADRSRGKFRTFVLACLKNFLHNSHRSDNAEKRGGHISFTHDFKEAENTYSDESRTNLSPEALFERLLALRLIDLARAELTAENIADGKASLYSALESKIFDSEADETYETLSTKLDRPVGTLKSEVREFRNRLREILRDHVAETLCDPRDVDQEIQYLQAALQS